MVQIITASLFYLLGITLVFSARWAVQYFGLSSFSQLVYHIKVPLSGTNVEVIYDWVKMCFLPSCLISIICILFSVYVIPTQVIILSIVVFLCLVCISLQFVGLPYYVKTQRQSSTLYETSYIDPSVVEIQFKKKKNLIHIYLESMEATHLMKKNGGNSLLNIVPELNDILEQSISFSNTNLHGGARQVISTGWTTAGLVGSTCGLPIQMSIGASSYGATTRFMKGAYSLGDILEKQGYNQMFLCGSDAAFGGRSYFYKQHGNFQIYDLYQARKQEDISKDYKVFWGFEDEKLFDIAKQQLMKLSKQDAPFNFTMLSVDTHHPNGYQCELCENEFSKPMQNILRCNSKQVGSFIEWIKEQSFYEDSVVILMGDHLSMAQNFMATTYDKDYTRTTYNAFLNTDLKSNAQKNRQFCVFDYYPTILASMGATIENNRLGFGTNLFSGDETLIEKMGFDSFNKELAKHSRYYNSNIL